MAMYTTLSSAVNFFFSLTLRKLFKVPRYMHRKNSTPLNSFQLKLQRNPSVVGLLSNELFSSSDDDKTLIFNVEETLLKSSSLFPYFMLVAFEAGSLLRALLLLTMYPFICLFSREMGLKIMVMVCFFGIKKDGFMVGRAVLPKFFLEDVGLEGFEVVKKCKRKVGVSDLPHVMIESFVSDYLEVDYVVGKELKVYGGYFTGLMEDNREIDVIDLENILGEGEIMGSTVFGINGTKASIKHPFFSLCKVSFWIYI